jgi:O-antigen/teichoic acid export membrane protein
VTAAAPVRSRSAERFRLARLAVVLGGVDRLLGSIASAVRVPLLLWGLGTREYGLYVAILGLVATANLLDFGLHYGVTNAVSEARGREDESSVRRTVSTGFVIYTMVSVAALLVLVPLIWIAPLPWLLNIEPAEAGLARLAASIGLGGILLGMPLKVSLAGLSGYQEQFVVSAFRSLSTVLQLAALAVAIALFHAHLVGVALVGAAADLALLAGCTVWVSIRRPLLAPRPRDASRTVARVLFGVGLAFFVTSIANVLKGTLGATIVSHSLGPAAVPAFSVPLALFTIALGLSGLVGASLWPAFGEAAARSDWNWVGRAFRLGFKSALLVAGLFATLGVLYGEQVIRVWAPRAGLPSRTFLALLAAWLLGQTIITTSSSVLAGIGRVRICMWLSLFEGVLVIAGSVALVGRFASEGVAGAMAMASLLVAVLFFCWAVPRFSAGLVQPFGSDLIRVTGCIVFAGTLGFFCERALSGVSPLFSLILGSAVTAGSYTSAAWWLGFDAGERDRIRLRPRRPISGGPAAESPTTDPPAPTRQTP